MLLRSGGGGALDEPSPVEPSVTMNLLYVCAVQYHRHQPRVVTKQTLKMGLVGLRMEF